MPLRRRDKAKKPRCCLCGAHISKEADDFFYFVAFSCRPLGDPFCSHRQCIEDAIHPILAPGLDRDEGYGTTSEEALQRKPLLCCLCGAGIDEPGERVGLWPWSAHLGDGVYFWTHGRCMRKAMHWRSWLRLRMKPYYGN
jgi:hypothetical protein